MQAAHHHGTPHQPDQTRHRGRHRTRRTDERGASLVEYAMLLALIAVVAVASVSFLGGSTSGTMQKGGDGISGHNPQAHCGQGSGNGETSHQFADEKGVIDPVHYPGPCPGGSNY